MIRIQLTHDKWAVIDAEDFELVLPYRWRANRMHGRLWYAVYLPTGGKALLMHRLIMGCSPGDGKIVDHINGDTLDNRRFNLRIATASENRKNRHHGFFDRWFGRR